MATESSKKPFEELVEDEQRMYYNKAQWLLANNYSEEDINILARRLYAASWRVNKL